jgi:hypothetical protein
MLTENVLPGETKAILLPSLILTLEIVTPAKPGLAGITYGAGAALTSVAPIEINPI